MGLTNRKVLSSSLRAYTIALPLVLKSVHMAQGRYLHSEQQMPVSMLQLLLPVFKVLSSLLFPLQLSDVVHGSLEDGSLVPPHVPVMR